jgi:hypothetical protein
LIYEGSNRNTARTLGPKTIGPKTIGQRTIGERTMARNGGTVWAGACYSNDDFRADRHGHILVLTEDVDRDGPGISMASR